MGRGTLTRAPIQELYDPTFESVANLDDLQRSWESLKNVVCESLHLHAFLIKKRRLRARRFEHFLIKHYFQQLETML